MDHKNAHARRLFDGIAGFYDPPAGLFSFGQYGRWRRYLVSRLEMGPGDTVLDLCTGTAGVAIDTARTFGCRVVGVDLSDAMLRSAREKVRRGRVRDNIDLVRGRAEGLPFPDACFDAVCFTFLLRYVEDPEATIGEIVRVLKPGGRLASLEFGVPGNMMARALWYAYTRGALPLGTRVVSKGWREVGAFLGPSICRFYRAYTVEQVRQMWLNWGIPDARAKRLSLGGAVVMWGTRSDCEVTRSRGT